ncbi:MAG: carboxylating nicotinate-nucleotide diphosphorylase [Planctomycetes bacterium]|nr:carboxylating nicotinate-nucleotide diphosphorylase [Planctomycetota bacterium]
MRALEEDCGRRPDGSYVFGDVTSDGAIPADRPARAKLVAKAHGVLAGLDVFARVFELCDPSAKLERLARDGQRIAPKDELLRIHGRARALLVGERTALNFVQRMCGTATLTAEYVALAGGRARILDTRKTTPGLRLLEKYAVRCGGGENHRFGLYDEAMVKNNHLDLAGKDLTHVLRELRAKLGDDFVITAEARDEAEALAAVAGGADIVLLDNLTAERMRALCPRMRAAAGARKLEIEASGGITLANLALVAQSGVDRISIGALTHSAPALDLSLYLEPMP